MKITVKLWLYMTVIVILVLSLVWFFLIMLLPDLYFDNANDRIDSLISEAVSLIVPSDSENLSTETTDKLHSICEANELRIELFAPNGSTIYFDGWGRGFTPLTSADFVLLRDGQYVTKRIARAGFSETLITAHPLYLNNRVVSILTASLPMAPVEDTLDILAEQLIIVIITALIVAIAVAFLLSQSFVRPIREMEQAALKIAEGEYAVPIHFRDRSEIGDLARTLNRMSEQLQQIETMRRQFIATVSHQFKTPLSIIQGHTELIADTLPPEISAKYTAQFNIISDEITRLDRMARDIMRLSQYQSESVNSIRTEVDLYRLCNELSSRFSVLGTNDAELVFSVPKNMTVLSDPVALHDILENLISNAIKHSKASRIELTAEHDETAAALIRIKDDGIGLTPEQQEHIWERFYKGDANDRSGNGLGMSIVKAMLDALGAEYGITVNGGTEIWIKL